MKQKVVIYSRRKACASHDIAGPEGIDFDPCWFPNIILERIVHRLDVRHLAIGGRVVGLERHSDGGELRDHLHHFFQVERVLSDPVFPVPVTDTDGFS